MKTIRYSIIAAVIIAATLPASAQNGRKDEINNWFIGAGAGMNISSDGGNFLTREFSHTGSGTAADFYIGKYFNPTFGFRVGYQGFTTSNTYIDYGKNPFQYIHADALFRAGKVAVPYIHAGYASIDKGSAAGGVGIMLPIKLSNRVSVIPDIKATAFGGKAFTDGVGNIGVNLSGTVGLQITLGKVNKKKVEPAVAPVAPVPVPAPVIVHDTVVVERVVEKIVEKPLPSNEELKMKEDAINRALSPIVLFDTDKYNISAQAKVILDEVVDYMLEYPGLKLDIEGHTDSTGGDEHNFVLSRNRAKAVADYLISKGVPADAISTEGFGKTRPVDTNATVAGRANNRRTEVHFRTE